MNKWVCLIFFFCFSCNNVVEETKYYDSGKVKEVIYKNEDGSFKSLTFYEDGTLKSEFFGSKTGLNDEKKFFNEDGVLIVSINWIDDNHIVHKDYYPNGKIKSEGEKINNKTFGWWKFYNQNGNLIEKKEYLTINEEVIENQSIIYYNGKKNLKKSSTIDFSIGDSIVAGKYIIIARLSEYGRPLHLKNKHFKICVSTKINEDFTNISKIKFDTIQTGNFNDLWFPIVLDKKGEINIRGFIDETYFGDYKNFESVTIVERKTYFNKKVFVK